MRTSRFPALAAAVVAATALAACSSSATTAKAGTETFTSGKVTSAKILQSNAPTLPLTFSGVVSATGSISLGGSGPKKGQTHTFVTNKGDLVLLVISDTSTGKFVNTKTCLAQDVTTVDYTVVGSKSTGLFKGATGSGVVAVTFQANSELKGKCSLAQNAQPATMANAYALFLGTGPMKVAA